MNQRVQLLEAQVHTLEDTLDQQALINELSKNILLDLVGRVLELEYRIVELNENK